MTFRGTDRTAAGVAQGIERLKSDFVASLRPSKPMLQPKCGN